MNTIRLNDAELAMVLEALDAYGETLHDAILDEPNGSEERAEHETRLELLESTAESVHNQA